MAEMTRNAAVERGIMLLASLPLEMKAIVATASPVTASTPITTATKPPMLWILAAVGRTRFGVRPTLAGGSDCGSSVIGAPYGRSASAQSLMRRTILIKGHRYGPLRLRT